MLSFDWNEVLKIVIFSAASVATLFIIAKVLGKKQIAELNFIDYVMGISIGSIAAEMATDINQTPIWYYVIAMFVFMIIDLIINFFERKSPCLKRFFKGKPETLIYEGQIQYKVLKKNGVSVNDLISMCRVQGYFNINDIAYAILETSGDLSVLPKGKEKPVTITDLKNPKIETASLPCHLVIDGKISYSGLNEINKDENWLLKNINCQNTKELKQFILISYDNKTKKFYIHKKD